MDARNRSYQLTNFETKPVSISKCMVETTSTTDGTNSDGSGGGLKEFATTPMGMGLIGGIAIALALGYYIL